MIKPGAPFNKVKIWTYIKSNWESNLKKSWDIIVRGWNGQSLHVELGWSWTFYDNKIKISKDINITNIISATKSLLDNYNKKEKIKNKTKK